MRFVLDSNLLVSGIIRPNSLPAKVIEVAQKSGDLCFSKETQSEIIEVISRNKFDRYEAKETRIQRLNAILRNATIVTIKNVYKIECRDPDDLKFLILAAEAKVDCICSGDADLTILHPFRGIPILAPTEFLDWLN
jgi:putative PIN family toxin of toxin-antitoxin system